MTTDHIDQLNEWWENAEKGTPREGDTYIARFPGRDGYETGVVDGDGLPEGMLPDTRILARSVKPKPAWHDAVAVIARVDDGSQTPDTSRVALLRDVNEPGQWVRGYCDNVYSDELFDMTPLIEAKVTDEMVDRGLGKAEEHGYIERVFGEVDGIDQNAFRAILAAALGLETA